jgi:hypothetical protein
VPPAVADRTIEITYDSHDDDYEAHPDASRSCAGERDITGEKPGGEEIK